MAASPATPPHSGRVITQDTRWITFETVDLPAGEGGPGCLVIRTLHGRKDIKDPQRAREIISLLAELANQAE